MTCGTRALAPTLALLLAACSQTAPVTAVPKAPVPAAPDTVAPDTVAPDAVAPETGVPATGAPTAMTPTASASALEHLRGQALMGKDGYGVTLCGETRQRIIALDPEAKAQLGNFLSNGAHTFDVDGWGTRIEDGQVRFASFERFGVEGAICDFDTSSFAFRAMGTEPFWRVDVTGALTVLERPDHPALSGPTRERNSSDGSPVFEAETSEGTLQVRFSPGPCHDGMSEAQYTWRAQASLATSHWSGCGFRGGASLPR
ncbi:hypothetical protein BH11PSE14_BH11PSE14_19380 [soil metagenome]